MAIISHHLQSVVRAARVAAWSSAFAFALTAVLAMAGFNQSGVPRTPASLWFETLLLGAFAAAFLVPGAAMWLLANRLEAGKTWTFLPILLLAFVEVPKLFLIGQMPCLALPFALPALYLGACCLNAIPDARDLYRQRRRARRPRGFEPIITVPRPALRPPPRPAPLARLARPARPPRPAYQGPEPRPEVTGPGGNEVSGTTEGSDQ